MDLEAESSARFREEEKRWVLISDPQIRMASESLEGWVTRCQSPKSGNKNFKKQRTFSQQCWEGVEKDLVVLLCPTLSYILLLLEGWTKESYQSPQAHSESFSHLKHFSGCDTLVAMLESEAIS